MTFSPFDVYSAPILFDLTELLNLFDLTRKKSSAVFMQQYFSNKLPRVFYETPVSCKHHYNARLASKMPFSLPHVRTTYGKF